MNKKQRSELIAELKDYGIWVRQGKTMPNRLAWNNKTQFQPVKASEYKGAPKPRERFDFECKHCQRTYLDRMTRPPSCGDCGGARFVKLIRTLLQTGMPKHSSPNRQGRSVEPSRFISDARLRRIDEAIERMDWDHRLVLRELYVNGKTFRELAPLLGMKSHNDVVTVQSEALGFLLAELRPVVQTGPNNKVLTNA